MLADIQMEKLEYLGIADKVDCLVTSEEAGVDKPGWRFFWLAMHKCRCLPEETVMVGDNFTHDIQGALDVGIDGVWLNWTDKPKPVGELSYTEVSTFEQAAQSAGNQPRGRGHDRGADRRLLQGYFMQRTRHKLLGSAGDSGSQGESSLKQKEPIPYGIGSFVCRKVV